MFPMQQSTSLLAKEQAMRNYNVQMKQLLRSNVKGMEESVFKAKSGSIQEKIMPHGACGGVQCLCCGIQMSPSSILHTRGMPPHAPGSALPDQWRILHRQSFAEYPFGLPCRSIPLPSCQTHAKTPTLRLTCCQLHIDVGASVSPNL